MSYLKREDALRLLRQTDQDKYPIPFSITFTKADIQRNTGGEVVHLKKAVLFRNHPKVRKKINPLSPEVAISKENSPFGGWGANGEDCHFIVCLHTQEVYLVHNQLISMINNITIFP